MTATQVACAGGPDLRLWRQGTRGAHPEHGLHVRDLGRVEAERLVERRRKLPSRKGRHEMREEVRPGRRVRALWGAATQAACAQGGLRLKADGEHRARAKRTSSMECMVATLDVSKLSGWLNADARCRVERAGMRCGKRCGPGGVGAWGDGDARHVHGEGPTQGWEGRARAERTPNMYRMVVTLDVSQLEMSALKFSK